MAPSQQSLERESQPDLDVSAALREAQLGDGRSLAELSGEGPVLLVFLRHLGCTFCRQALSDLARARPAIERRGAALVLVHMGEPDGFHALTARHGLGDVPAVSDVARRLYEAFGLGLGSLGQLLGPSAVMNGLCAFAEGHGVGSIVGEPRQMPGVFVVRAGRVVNAFRHRHAGARPDYVGLLAEHAAPVAPPAVAVGGTAA